MKNQTIISLLCCLLLFVTGCSISHQGNTYDIMTYGAKGDGQTDDAAAIQRAINACSAAGGGTVIIPAGHTFLCGPLYLKSYVNLHLEPNSRLLANPDESIYTESAFRENRGSAVEEIPSAFDADAVEDARELDGIDAAVVGGVLGVAENGAVWLPQRARHKALYFAVESLVILLPRDAVVATMQDAVEDPRFDRDFGFGCFMSGPSKTADIEQALVIGAHGPMSVTVVLTGGKEAAR